jgi:hypothetical protein
VDCISTPHKVFHNHNDLKWGTSRVIYYALDENQRFSKNLERVWLPSQPHATYFNPRVGAPHQIGQMCHSHQPKEFVISSIATIKFIVVTKTSNNN